MTSTLQILEMFVYRDEDPIRYVIAAFTVKLLPNPSNIVARLTGRRMHRRRVLILVKAHGKR